MSASAYASSTQARFWTLTPAAFSASQHARRDASSTLVSSPPSTGAAPSTAKRVRADDEGAASGVASKRARVDDGSPVERSDGGDAGERAVSAPAYPLSVADEEAVLRWSARALLRLCRCKGLDRAVTATASIYLRRFYVAGLLAEYPPPEMITACVFLAVKTEACPYTEFEPLSRKLAEADADWRRELDALLLGDAGRAGDGGVVGAARGDAEEDDIDPRYLANEAPLLRGLRFHLCVYAPFRPLLALLGRAVAAGVGGGERDESARKTWDAVQARALAAAEAALSLTPLALTLSPVELAAAALLAAAAARSNLTLVGAGGLDPADGDKLAGSVQIWPPLEHAPEHAVAAQLAAVGHWLRGALGCDRAFSAAEAGAQEITAALADVSPAADAAALESVIRLARSVDPSLSAGTPAHAARLASLQGAVAAMKAKKASTAEAAAKAAADVVLRENAAWGVVEEERA